MLGAGHGAARRWAVVAAVVGILVALPPVIGLWPVSDADVPAAELRERALAADRPFSGYAESAGGLVLPVGERSFSRVVDLFSDRTQMRVWWRGARNSRVDVVSAGGETGYYRDSRGGWRWEYEDDQATRLEPIALTLPSPPDLLPSSLGRRLLSEATDDELSRIGADRVAGRRVLGVRISPAEAAASVSRVDVWIDAETGLPLRVLLFADDTELPALDTRFLDVDFTEPGAAVTRFLPPRGARVSLDQNRGVLDRAGRALSGVPLPDRLAGLPRRTIEGAPEEVGLYGRGVTLLAVVPVPEGLAVDLVRELGSAPDAVDDELGLRVTAGPVGVAVLNPPGDLAFVVTGTVTIDALAVAAADLGLDS